MKTLLATTALGLMLATPMMAETTMTKPETHATATATFYTEIDHPVMASDLIGKRVYASDVDIDMGTTYTEIDAGWDDIGEVSDVAIGLNGDVEAVLVDIGGFLGIGEKTVAVNLAALGMIPDGDDADDYFIVMKGARADLDAAPAFMADTPAMEQSDATDTMPADADMAPAVIADMSAEDLTGKAVWGPNADKVGDVGEVLLDDNMKVSGVVIDVGGFLGMGEKPVEVSPADLSLMQDGDETTIHIALTKDQLKSMPEYQG